MWRTLTRYSTFRTRAACPNKVYANSYLSNTQKERWTEHTLQQHIRMMLHDKGVLYSGVFG